MSPKFNVNDKVYLSKAIIPSYMCEVLHSAHKRTVKLIRERLILGKKQYFYYLEGGGYYSESSLRSEPCQD